MHADIDFWHITNFDLLELLRYGSKVVPRSFRLVTSTTIPLWSDFATHTERHFVTQPGMACCIRWYRLLS